MTVLVILVNWNGWRDTVECLESLARCDGNFDVVVCDNASTDRSLERITSWANGDLKIPTEAPPWKEIRPRPRRQKIITHERFSDVETCIHDRSSRWLTLIETGANLGFAGANNVGLKYGLARQYNRFLLLNTDTLISRHAIDEMGRRMDEDPLIGICGASILYYDRPELHQCYGGAVYHKWTGRSTYIGYLSPDQPRPPSRSVESQLSYVTGAAMMVSRVFIETVGLMSERYFLYFEEIDWVIRSHGQFRLGYAPDATIFHKHGGSIGGSSRKGPSQVSLTFSTRGRLLFTSMFFPFALPVVFVSILMDALKYLLKGNIFASRRIILESLNTLCSIAFRRGARLGGII